MKTINSFNGRIILARGIFASLFVLMMSACQEDSELLTQQIDDETITTVTSHEEVFALYEEVEEMAMDVTENRQVEPDNRMAVPFTEDWRCGTITHDTLENLITIDFGVGCIGKDGKTRSGKILISYDRRLYVPGAKRTITLENYVVDSIQVFGTKTLTNQSETISDFISLNVELIKGKVIWPDNSMATRSYDRTKTWLRAANPLKDEFQIEGYVSGVNRAGSTYKVEIVEPLIYKRICRIQGAFLPVEGIKYIERTGKPDTEINYGEGECDNSVIITQSQDSREVNIAAEMKRLRKLAGR